MNIAKISIVVPVYNEEKTIVKAIDRIVNSKTHSYHKEIVIIDDASTDKTSSILKSIPKKGKGFEIIVGTRKINEGKGAAVREGFLKTTGDVVIVQDSDLEYDPADYPVLLEPFLSYDADVVYGSRFISNRPHRILYFWHYMANTMLTLFSNMLSNLNLTDMETGYKVFKGDLIRKIAPNLKTKRFGFEPEITAKIAKIKELKIYEVGISYTGRTYKEGKKIGWKDGVRAIIEILWFNIFDR